MAECPTCGETFDTAHAVKSHQGAKHGEKPGKVNVECDWCAKITEKRKDRSTERDNNFCSKDCYYSWCEENIEPEDCPRWDGGKKTISCCWCGDEIKRYPSVISSSKRNFCNVDCRTSWFSENKSGKQSPNYKRVTVYCEVCDTEIEKMPCMAEDQDVHLCSRECHTEYMSGPTSPNWKGGAVHYGNSWYNQREKAIQRDNSTCCKCGLTRSEHKEKHGRDIEVHHIKPLRTFANTKEAHRLSNLITVCKICHLKMEHSTKNGNAISIQSD